MQKVTIEDPGSSLFLPGDRVDINEVINEIIHSAEEKFFAKLRT